MFVPIIFFYYPETAGRSLEEMDIIFAKAYAEKRPAYKVAQTMPFLSPEQVEQEASALGLYEVESDFTPKDNSEKEEHASMVGSSTSA